MLLQVESKKRKILLKNYKQFKIQKEPGNSNSFKTTKAMIENNAIVPSKEKQVKGR